MDSVTETRLISDMRTDACVRDTKISKHEVDAGSVPNLDFEISAPLVKGDHIHALPYWNEFGRAVIPESRATMHRAYYTTPPDSGISLPPTFPSCIKGHRIERIYDAIDVDLAPRVPWKLPDLPQISAAELEFLKVAARTKALASARKAMVNLPMILKERRETISMVGKRASSIASAARSLQEKDLGTWRRTPKGKRRQVASDIANGHLEAVFGWLPIMGEIEGACEFISQEPEITHIKVRGNHGQFDSGSETRETPMYLWGLLPGWEAQVPQGRAVAYDNVQSAVSVRCALRYEITSGIQSARQLGADPIGFLFDAYPLSFTLGWISNLDKWIRNLSPLVGLEFTTGSETVRYQRTVDGQLRWVPPGPSAGYPVVQTQHTTSAYSLNRTRYERSVLTKEPESGLQWQNNLSLFSVTAGASLAIQRYSKPLARLLDLKKFRVDRRVYTE